MMASTGFCVSYCSSYSSVGRIDSSTLVSPLEKLHGLPNSHRFFEYRYATYTVFNE